MKTIKVRPLTQWAKNKVQLHGDTYEVVEERRCRWGNVLVRSLERTWRSCGENYFWAGWFDVGVDVELV